MKRVDVGPVSSFRTACAPAGDTAYSGYMTIEIGGFIALAALMVGLFAWLRQDISALHVRVSNLEARMDTQMADLRERMDTQNSDLRERMAKLEGLP